MDAKPVGHHLQPLAVEAEAVDHGAVGGEAEHPRPGVAGLGPRDDPAHLDEAEAEAQQRVGHARALVESGREADRVGEAAAQQVDGEARVVRRPGAGGQERQGAERQVVRALRVEAVEQRPDEGEGGGDHAGRIPAGKACRPSASSGISSTATTAESGSGP